MPARIALAVLAALVPLPGQEAAPLDVHSMIQLRRAVEAVISPDGGQVAYVVWKPRAPDEEDGPAWRELYLAQAAGGESQGLVTGKVTVRNVAFARDGRITFLAELGEEDHVRVHAMRPGEEPRALSPEGVGVKAYALSPDGTSLAYTSRAAEDPGRAAWRKKGFDREVFEEELRPVELHVADLEAGGSRKVPLGGSVYEVAFSPDGSALFFTMAPTPLVDDRYMARDLYRVVLESMEVNTVADVPGKLGSFAPSPDGGRVAYIAGRDVHDPHESSLYVVAASGGWATGLTPEDFEGEVHRVAWLDEETLLVQATEGCHRSIFTQPASGGDRTLVLPARGPVTSGLSLSRSSRRLATVASTPRHPREVYIMRLGQPLRRLTYLNPGLEDVLLGEQEVIAYEARDGLGIQGVLVHPAGGAEGPHPLIVMVHGGPESAVLDGWNTRYATPAQVAAGRGYAVFFPNYRSSTGRGVRFSKLGQGDAAGAEFDDILEGIDHLAGQGLVDKKKVGITGGSYGGYFTAWGATRHSEHFAAGVMFVGISDQLSKLGTTDIPEEAYYSHWRVRPWEAVDLLLERSPILYTDDARTPLLILHGKDDPRVSVTQSMELYRWLKLRGEVPVRLVLYPGEGHGNRRRASRLDYALRAMRWFDHFLLQGKEDLPSPGVDYSPAGG